MGFTRILAWHALAPLLLAACATGAELDPDQRTPSGGIGGTAGDASMEGGTGGTSASAGSGGSVASGGSAGMSTGGTSSDASAGASGAGSGGVPPDAGGSGGSSDSAAAGAPGCDAGVVEVCNGTDDDADGLIDEPSSQNTAACNGCVPVQRGDFAYWFCTTARDWAPARDNCTSKGGQLGSIHDLAENDFVTSTMAGLGVSGRFWFGLNDRSSEASYVWLDGTPLDFTYFNCSTTSMPNTGDEDCANIIASSKCWDDDDCSGHDFAYLCKAPHPEDCP